MNFPLRLPAQLKQHLRALRKSRALTQAQLGSLVGVGQARIAEIEANPGAVSLDQITQVLAALGGSLHLHSAEGAGAASPTVPEARPKVGQPGPRAATKRAPTARRNPTQAGQRSQVPSLVIRPKKGTW
jgi:HTH-type transcriptional regulator/antitoxin HipB